MVSWGNDDTRAGRPLPGNDLGVRDEEGRGGMWTWPVSSLDLRYCVLTGEDWRTSDVVEGQCMWCRERSSKEICSVLEMFDTANSGTGLQ